MIIGLYLILYQHSACIRHLVWDLLLYIRYLYKISYYDIVYQVYNIVARLPSTLAIQPPPCIHSLHFLEIQQNLLAPGKSSTVIDVLSLQLGSKCPAYPHRIIYNISKDVLYITCI